MDIPIELTVNIIITVIICFCTLTILMYLLYKRNTFPYTNISPLWNIITLASIL